MSWLFWLFVLVLLAAASGSAYMAYRTYVAGDTGPNLKGWLFKPRPEPRLGDFEEGVVMTRFFSEVCLEPDGNGALRPIEAPAPDTVTP